MIPFFNRVAVRGSNWLLRYLRIKEIEVIKLDFGFGLGNYVMAKSPGPYDLRGHGP